MDLVSIRLGISLVALAPIMLASVMQSRNELLARLHYMAMHDPLTGARNRDSFRAAAQLALDKDRDGTFALMMVDLDHFKAVNDRFGHAAGDRALAWFGEHARGCLRPGDILGRMGGEEFAILVPGCDQQGAAGLAERLRAVISAPIPMENGASLVVTASIGLLAIRPGDGRSIDELLPAADKLLYAAKEKGRNRVETGGGATA
jgi:diguanylate cyclase (GGDEF)-like protein